MKKYSILLALLFCLVGSIFAQPAPMNKKVVKTELIKTLKGLDMEGLQELYQTATDKLAGDLPKKKLLKGIRKATKQMPLNEQIDLLDYAKDVAQNGVIYPLFNTYDDDGPIVEDAPPPPPSMPPANMPEVAENPAPQGPISVIKFEYLEFDFGTIEQGEKVTHSFKYTNAGTEPLMIISARGSCGCTVPKWPKEPIPPGASREITVTFNSKGKKNKRRQKVTIKANTTPSETMIYLKGFVNAPEGEQKTPKN